MDSRLLTIVTFLPLAGALVIGFSPVRWARILALATALATWAVSIWVAINFNAEAGTAVPAPGGAAASEFQMVEVLNWIPAFGIQYKLGIDGLSLALVVLTTTLTWISILASFAPIQIRVKEYMISFLILEVGMTGVFLALDTFLFYIFWEVVLVPMYLIIGIWGGQNRIYATIKFVLYTLVGSLLMLVAILATAFAYQGAHGGQWAGAFDFDRPARVRRHGRLRRGPPAPELRRLRRSPSRSRCRCSRSTPGCPTRTSRRRPRARSSSPACCSSWAATDSSASTCRSIQTRRIPMHH